MEDKNMQRNDKKKGQRNYDEKKRKETVINVKKGTMTKEGKQQQRNAVNKSVKDR